MRIVLLMMILTLAAQHAAAQDADPGREAAIEAAKKRLQTSIELNQALIASLPEDSPFRLRAQVNLIEWQLNLEGNDSTGTCAAALEEEIRRLRDEPRVAKLDKRLQLRCQIAYYRTVIRYMRDSQRAWTKRAVADIRHACQQLHAHGARDRCIAILEGLHQTSTDLKLPVECFATALLLGKLHQRNFNERDIAANYFHLAGITEALVQDVSIDRRVDETRGPLPQTLSRFCTAVAQAKTEAEAESALQKIYYLLRPESASPRRDLKEAATTWQLSTQDSRSLLQAWEAHPKLVFQITKLVLTLGEAKHGTAILAQLEAQPEQVIGRWTDHYRDLQEHLTQAERNRLFALAIKHAAKKDLETCLASHRRSLTAKEHQALSLAVVSGSPHIGTAGMACIDFLCRTPELLPLDRLRTGFTTSEWSNSATACLLGLWCGKAADLETILLTALSDRKLITPTETYKLRMFAVRLAAFLQYKTAVPHLHTILKDQESPMFLQAYTLAAVLACGGKLDKTQLTTWANVDWPDDPSRDHQIRFLSGPSERYRIIAANIALWLHYGDQQAADAVFRLTRHRWRRYIAAAIVTLGMSRQLRAKDLLTRLLADDAWLTSKSTGTQQRLLYADAFSLLPLDEKTFAHLDKQLGITIPAPQGPSHPDLEQYKHQRHRPEEPCAPLRLPRQSKPSP